MKKIFVIFSSVVLFFSLLIVPASAAEAEYYDVDFYAGQNFSGPGVPVGLYSVSLVLPSLDASYELSTNFEVSHDANCYAISSIIYLDVSYDVQFCPDPSGSNSIVEISDSAGNYLDADGYLRFTPVAEPLSFVDGVLAVFSGIGSWFISSLLSVSVLFWNPDIMQLTLFGVMSIVAVGVALILLLIYHISQRMRFKT